MVVKDGTEMLRWAGVYQYMMIVKDGTEDVEMVWCLSVYIYMIGKDGTEDVEMVWCLSVYIYDWEGWN